MPMIRAFLDTSHPFRYRRECALSGNCGPLSGLLRQEEIDLDRPAGPDYPFRPARD